MIPRAPLERIMRNAGAERVSEDAVEVLREASEDVAEEIANEAVEASRDEDRNTIERADIKLASER